jgi:hypothetical protein
MLGDRTDARIGMVEIPIGRLEEACPLLVSCYYEAFCLASQPITVRRVARDFTLHDLESG